MTQIYQFLDQLSQVPPAILGNEEDCLAHLERLRWPEGVCCTACDSKKVSKFRAAKTSRRIVDQKTGTRDVRPVPPRTLYQCLECGHQFTATAGTLFHKSHLPLSKWFAALALIDQTEKPRSSLLKRELGVNARTARYVIDRIQKLGAPRHSSGPDKGHRDSTKPPAGMQAYSAGRRERGTQTRPERISRMYKAAAEVICRKGYASTSMDEIAAAMGLTKPGLYHHISSKEELLYKIMTFSMERLGVRIQHLTQVSDPEERLFSIVVEHASSMLNLDGGPITILIEEVSELTPAHQEVVKSRKREYFELIRNTLGELAACGKLRDVNLSVAAFNLLAMLNWLPRWYRKDGSLPVATVIRDFAEIAMNSVLKCPTARPPIISVHSART